jgi:DNA-binding transcriptional LysR family regulator
MHNWTSLDWNDLRYFLAVAREGSTLAAARALRINQSTVHRRLVALEKLLGCALAERHPTGYRLTELGKQLRSYVEKVEDSVDALQRHVMSFDKSIKGNIRLTCPTGVGHLLMKSHVLDNFHARHPELKVELLMTDRFFDLSKGEADIAIRGGQPKDNALIGRKIADEPWAIYGSHSYVDRHGRPKRLEDLNDHKIIEFIDEIADHRAWRWLQSKAPRATICGQSTNIPGVLLAVKSDGGLAPLPAPLADRDDDLLRVLGPIAELSSSMYLLTHRDLRKIPRISVGFDYCVLEFPPVVTGLGKRKSS